MKKTNNVKHIIEDHIKRANLEETLGTYVIKDGHELYFYHGGERIMVNYNQFLKYINVVIMSPKQDVLKNHKAFKDVENARLKFDELWAYENWKRRDLLRIGKHGSMQRSSKKLYFRVQCSHEGLYYLVHWTKDVITKILAKSVGNPLF